MKKSKFSKLTEQEMRWMDDYLSESISEEEFSKMQDHLASSAPYRHELRKFLAIDNFLFSKWDGIEEENSEFWANEETIAPVSKPTSYRPTLIAALLGVLATSTSILFFSQQENSTPTAANQSGAVAEGFAVLRNLANAEWRDGTGSKTIGTTLSAETISLESGIAEIQFFSGANMILEGPATIALKSAWEADCLNGTVRMQVPPAARGFKLHAPETEIVDLGTEFGLTVKGGESQVAVFDGEIEFRHRNGETRLVQKGAAWNLPNGAEEVSIPLEKSVFPDSSHLAENSLGKQDQSFLRWENYRNRLADDPRLIAYYTFESEGSAIPDLANSGDSEQQGTTILAEPVPDRWGDRKTALDFKRPGARVRVNIPGEFSAYTFMSWVRIDSLDRQYSALFLGDGYENGEPHWQIRDDGKLMLSVMIDDTQKSIYPNDTAGRHRVYFSPPIWNISMSGDWMHITSVYDPANRSVSHYIDGETVSHHRIAPNDVVKTLRIGNGEIGNWGQPFRTDPTFAIRNLNGRMGEFAIFDAALSAEEIKTLFNESKKEK